MTRWLSQFVQPAPTRVSHHGLGARSREGGQTFVEYALLLAFIAVVALVAVNLLGTNVSSLFDKVASSF